jgi:hypothetical protein
MYLRDMIVECPLVSCQLVANRLPEWCNTPHFNGISGVSPDPLLRSQDGFVLPENAGASEGPGIMDAIGMTYSIINNGK